MAISKKLNALEQVLQKLATSIGYYDKQYTIFKNQPSHEHELAFLSSRDSMIQRFEYCTDLFWKVLKLYLEDVEKVTLTTYSPKGIIREVAKTRTFSEQQAEEFIKMINDRNITSHMYHEEIAQEIAEHVPSFYELMREVADIIKQKSAQS